MVIHAANTPAGQRAPEPGSKFAARLLAIGLLLASFALRLFQLGTESLWYDETVSVYLARQPLVDLVAHTARDIHPPGYYLLLYLWRQIVNPTLAFGLEPLYAWPSLFLAMLVVALTYAVAKRCFGSSAARWALALALLHPTQIWFSQEVRMYALGAFALMLSLWAITPFLTEQSPEQTTAQATEQTYAPSRRNIPRSAIILYPIAALIGLYALYYFTFWLIVLNLCVAVRLWRHRQDLQQWVALQVIVVIGWLPWLPTFWRQVIDPPVPPWRVPWQSAPEILASLAEAVAALWTAHIVPFSVTWPWALLVIIVGAAFAIGVTTTSKHNRLAWLLLAFGPPLILFDMTLVGPPIYHVRYVSTYAPIFIIILAALLARLYRFFAILIYTGFAALAIVTLADMWNNPAYAADDHRGAVATLARQWRPGDAVLVNAGWAYTALSVYWPTELPAPDATRPPQLAAMRRLLPHTPDAQNTSLSQPQVYMSGSVGGESNLGWGLPQSDFFAIPEEDIQLALTQLAANHTRIWHYRIYDTVSDPRAAIRTWLKANTILEQSLPIAGRDYLLLERYRSTTARVAQPSMSSDILYPDLGLHLSAYEFPEELPAGEMLYFTLSGELVTDTHPIAAISLRLYDSLGNFIAQQDEPLAIDTNIYVNQSLALPIPAATAPGEYYAAIVIYAPETLAPYTAVDASGNALPIPLLLGELEIKYPRTLPHTPWAMASFDYIDLIEVNLPPVPLAAGATFESEWTWQPRQNDYRDHYIATVRFVELLSQTPLRIDFDLGSPNYPSSAWRAQYPVTQRVRTILPADLPPGSYEVYISLSRASDGREIPARHWWQPWPKPNASVGTIQITK